MTSTRFTLAELATETHMSLAYWRKQVWLKRIEVERYGRSVRVTAEALDQFRQRQKHVPNVTTGTDSIGGFRKEVALSGACKHTG
jgi:hypothetical protein